MGGFSDIAYSTTAPTEFMTYRSCAALSPWCLRSCSFSGMQAT